jgi:two-component system, chemotaxis family, chemotaxis protein CheY
MMSEPTGAFRTIARSDLQVLVVDDFSSVRRAEREMLVALGLDNKNIADTNSGSAALAFLLSSEKKPHIIITDINMPDGNGMDLLRTVKANPVFADIPVIMVTAEPDKDTIIQAASAGASSYIVKPFTGVTLEEKLSKAMTKSGIRLI